MPHLSLLQSLPLESVQEASCTVPAPMGLQNYGGPVVFLDVAGVEKLPPPPLHHYGCVCLCLCGVVVVVSDVCACVFTWLQYKGFEKLPLPCFHIF